MPDPASTPAPPAARPSVWNLPTPPRREETQTFTDPATGYAVTLTVQEATALDLIEVQQRSQELAQKWCQPGKDGQIPLYRGIDGSLHRLKPKTIETLVTLETLQGGDPAGLIGFSELLGIAVKLPALFMEIVPWAFDFLPREGDLGNALPADGEGSSAPPPDSAGSTPETPSTSIPSGGASTSDSPAAPA